MEIKKFELDSERNQLQLHNATSKQKYKGILSIAILSLILLTGSIFGALSTIVPLNQSVFAQEKEKDEDGGIKFRITPRTPNPTLPLLPPLMPSDASLIPPELRSECNHGCILSDNNPRLTPMSPEEMRERDD